jgi:very-short-patch-repair endonuclease
MQKMWKDVLFGLEQRPSEQKMSALRICRRDKRRRERASRIRLFSLRRKDFDEQQERHKAFELDEYIEEKKLAIELDGLYWHSDEAKPDPLYHLNKTEMCEKLGIRLIHIFDVEWILKNEIVKSRIMSLFGIYSRTIYARSCEVRVLHDKSESGKFQDENHIQGAVWSSIDIGLYYGDELVSLMTFGGCRLDKSHEWELLRFCSKLNTRVVGGAGKLLKYFEKKY